MLQHGAAPVATLEAGLCMSHGSEVVPSCTMQKKHISVFRVLHHSRVVNIVDEGANDWKWETIVGGGKEDEEEALCAAAGRREESRMLVSADGA